MDFLVQLIVLSLTFVLMFIAGQQRPLASIKQSIASIKQSKLALPSMKKPQFLSEVDEDDDDDESNYDLDDEEDSPSPIDTPALTPNIQSINQPMTKSSPAPSPVFSSRVKRRRVVIVALKLPVRSTRVGDGWKFEWEDTRNYLSALKVLSNHQEIDLMWVGAPNSDTPISREEEDAYEEGLYDFNCIPVFLKPELHAKFYQGFCKSMLWPMLHYVMPSSNQHFGEIWDDRWQAYTAANSAYASVVTHALETPQDMILIHNYHLLLLPSFLRAKLPRAKIALFIHTPFPSSDVFRVLPTRQNILSSILATDLLGFHTFDYARHFLSCIKRVMDLDFETLPGGALGVKYNGRFVSISISHVGIDSPTFVELSQSELFEQRVAEIRDQFQQRSIVFGVDDFDPVKGAVLKVHAYRHFLKTHPNLISKMVFVQVFLPANGGNDDHVRTRVMEECESIRQQFGASCLHIIQLNAITDFTQMEMCAWFRAADVLCVSSLWEGLNMIPYEFSACQGGPRPAAMILSEFMGCSRSLNGVIRVNPWSLTQVSDAIAVSLHQSDEERQSSHSRRFHYVVNHSIERWGLGFLEQLDRATKSQASMNYVHIGWGSNVKLVGLRSDFTHLDEDAVATGYRKANKRVLLLDYDGTLTPLDRTNPNQANLSQPRSRLIGPTAEVKRILRALCNDEDNCVFIMSGRTRSVLTDWFDDMPQLGLAAEKGLFLKWPQRDMLHCRYDGWQPEWSQQERREVEAQIMAENQRSLSTVQDFDDISSTPVIGLDWECLIPLEDVSWKDTAMALIRSYTDQTDGSWIEPKEFAIVWHYENADPEYGRMQAAELQKYLIKLLANPSVDVVKYDYARLLEVKPHGISKGLAATAILESLFMKSKSSLSTSPSNSNMLSLQREFSNRETSFPTLASPSQRPSFSQNSPYNGPMPPTSRPVSPPSNMASAAVPDPFLLCIGDDRSDEEMFIAVNDKAYLKGEIRGTPEMKRVNSNNQSNHNNQNNHNNNHINNNNNNQNEEKSNSNIASDVSIALVGARRDEEDEKWEVDPMQPRTPPDSFTFTVCVGMKPSNAHYYLQDEEEVIRTLESLSTASARMAQTRAADAAHLTRTMSMGSLQRGVTEPNFQSGGSSQNLQNLLQMNSMTVGHGSRPQLGRFGMTSSASLHQMHRRAPLDSDDDTDESDSDEENQYGSGSDEEGQTITVS